MVSSMSLRGTRAMGGGPSWYHATDLNFVLQVMIDNGTHASWMAQSPHSFSSCSHPKMRYMAIISCWLWNALCLHWFALPELDHELQISWICVVELFLWLPSPFVSSPSCPAWPITFSALHDCYALRKLTFTDMTKSWMQWSLRAASSAAMFLYDVVVFSVLRWSKFRKPAS